jgi:sigma-B regulation protein RsbU (phosphoserine phosphatase)
VKVEKLRQEITRLRTERAAFEAQRKLFENFVAMARSPAEVEMLKGTLQKTLEVSTELTGAEKGSLFLLDENGAVTDSILTRSDATPEQRSQLIGTVLDKGLAGWVINHRKTGLITDTEKDDRWLTLPGQPYDVRSALAVPILRGGELLGIITLLHSRPGHFNEEIAALMQAAADQIGLALENVRLYAKLDDSYRFLERAKRVAESYSKALDEQLEKGRQIQKDFLPQRIPDLPDWDICASFHPASQVSGDFYDVFILPGNQVGIVVADVCDKGVGAALFMGLFRSLIRVFSGQTRLAGLSIVDIDSKRRDKRVDPRGSVASDQIFALKAVGLTNNYIEKNHGRMCMFATLFFGILNQKTGLLTYINAGHDPLYVIGSEGMKKRLHATGPAVGFMPDAVFDMNRAYLEPGDILVGYTDGVTEACSPEGELFTKARLQAIVDRPFSSASDLLEHIKNHLMDFTGNMPQSDDITLIAAQRLRM